MLFFTFLFGFSCTERKSGQSSVQEKKEGKVGDTFYIVINSEPESLHPISSVDVYSRQVQGYTVDSLMVRNSDTYEWEPALAERYEVGPNDKYYTFYLRKSAKFHNGDPVTAHDVKFVYDAIMNPAFKAMALQPYYENIKSVEVIDKYTVRFYIKKRYFNNFNVIAGSIVIPKSVYSDPKKKLNKTIVASGPYYIEKYKKGKSIILKRNKNWWGWKIKKGALAETYNFNKIYIRFSRDETMRLEMVKKGKVDFTWLTGDQYVKKTNGKMWGKKVFKKEVKNKIPKGFNFVGLNFSNDLFKEREVRIALTHLMNRKLMNEKFKSNKSLLATGPWYPQSMYADPSVKPIPFSPKKAQVLLRNQGWVDSDKNGVLDKKIKSKRRDFSFTLLFSNKDTEKYLTVYKEDLKKAGILMKLQYVEWNSFLKSLDSKKFDAVALGWGGGSVHNDPKQIWHSSSARKGGSNFIGYKNAEVDKLIDEGRTIIDNKKRKEYWKKVFKLIANDAPYIFMFVRKFDHYAVTKKIQMPKETYQYGIGMQYWWSL